MAFPGVCRKCGKCCRVLIVPFIDDEAGVLREFLDARGIKYTVLEGGRLDAEVPHVCPQLTPDGCALEEAGKPLACRLFPAADQRCLYDRSDV